MDNADPHTNYSYFYQARVVKQTSSGRMGGGTVLQAQLFIDIDPQSLYCETKPGGGLHWT